MGIVFVHRFLHDHSYNLTKPAKENNKITNKHCGNKIKRKKNNKRWQKPNKTGC